MGVAVPHQPLQGGLTGGKGILLVAKGVRFALGLLGLLIFLVAVSVFCKPTIGR